MSIPKKKGLVPVLRFPEFRDAGEWEQLSIGDKVDLLSGYPFKGEEISEDSSGIPLMRGINITEGHIRHSRDIDRFFLGDAQYFEKYLLQNNDLVIGMDGSKVGKNSALITDKDSGALLIQRVARLRTECKATISFIFQHIHSIKFHSYVDRINTSSGIPHISAKQINEFEIFFPPVKKEQQKIADCLSSIDGLVTAQTQKVEALKAHKKGLMQQLFPAEGETIPKLRFPEFRDAGEWNENPLGNVCSTISSGKDKIESNGELDLYGSTGVIGKTSNDSYHGNFILVARVGANAGLLTRANGKFGVTDNTLVIVLKASQKIDFIYYSLDRLGLNKMVFGSGQPLITGGQLKSLVVNFPSPEEQQKIADCLSSIDDLLAAQTQKLATLKAHKKGLMQQLFPSVDLVTE
jgi:type I restriction enzyme S subunit